jgi:PAS domain S-box-containing protein
MMTMRAGKPSVAIVLAATLVTATTIVFSGLAAVSYFSERTREELRLKNGVEGEARQLSAALALPVWNIDRAQIEKILDTQADTPAVQAIVVDAAGRTHARSRTRTGQLVASDGRVAVAGLLSAESAITFSGARIGSVRLFATNRYVREQLRRSLVSMGVMIVTVDLLLIASVYLVLWRTLIKPLTAIEMYAMAVSRGSGAVRATPPDSLFTAELESLRSSIEMMVRQLDDRYAQLQEQEELTNAAINSISGVFVVQDRAGHYIRWNSTLERLAAGGTPIRERVGRELVHPDDRELVERAVSEVFSRGQIQEVEARLVAGSDVKYYAFSARRMDVRGQSFLVTIGTDITARREAEAEQRRLQLEIARSATEWQETFDTVTTPILITAPGGEIVRVNRAVRELSGQSAEALVGRRIDDISGDEPWQTARQLVGYIESEGEGTSAETKDSDGRTWDITITQFSNPREGAERFIIVMWEITGIVELQESLRRSETLSAMGNVVAGVAHEVRNPLFGISATLDAHHEEMSRPGYVEFAATLRQEVNRLVHLMQELLEYGKPGALSIESGSIADVIARAVQSRQQAAGAARVSVRSGFAAPVPAFLMDASRLRQVFENLIDNAVQHTEAGGSVQITSSVVEHAGSHWVECRVEDDGSGFPSEALDRVFEPFFTMREEGTGLGLSIVQRIVEDHSGKVFASNRPDGGGSIRLLFPIADSEASGASAAS